MKTVRVALVVQNCTAGHFEKNLESTGGFISRAARKGANMVVFPEMNLTGYVSGPGVKDICQPVDERLVDWFSTLAAVNAMTILVGLAEKTSQKKVYASHLVFDDKGFQGVYRKLHTAPFEKKNFAAGEKINVFQSQGLTFGIQLCYDAHFPELTLAMALKKADVIFIPHASPRGSSQEKYDSWVRHLRARAFDNGLYIAACNQTGDNSMGLSFPGVSLLIGPDGHVIDKSIDAGEGIHMVTIDQSVLNEVRSHKMKYFLPNRRNDLFNH